MQVNRKYFGSLDACHKYDALKLGDIGKEYISFRHLKIIFIPCTKHAYKKKFTKMCKTKKIECSKIFQTITHGQYFCYLTAADNNGDFSAHIGAQGQSWL